MATFVPNMNIRESYQRLKQWQKSPVAFTMSHDKHRCQNCGHEFEGNFCPCCGQRGGTGLVTWHSIREGVMDLWGIGTRSMPYTLWQLLFRPGYLIGEYISGHKQVSFPPVKMLVIVATLIFVINNLTQIHIFGPEDTQTATEAADLMGRMELWLSKHYDWASLLFFMFLLLPTNIVFRYSPRLATHNMPQGFFIQVFNSTLFLILVFLTGVVTWALNLQSTDTSALAELCIIITLQLIIVYSQLFGYRLWDTVWRIAMVGILSVFEIITVAVLLQMLSIIFTASDYGHTDTRISVGLFGVAAFLLTVECYKAAFYDRPVQSRWQRAKEKAVLVFLCLNILGHIAFIIADIHKTFVNDGGTDVGNWISRIVVFGISLIVLITVTTALVRKIRQRHR